MTERLLDVQDLKVHFHTDNGLIKAVDGVDFHMHAGESLGVVGESGCGKSVTALSILKLIQCPPGEYVGGRILLKGTDLLDKDENFMRTVRGNSVSMIFQEPMTSLNPAHTIGRQIMEPLLLHKGSSRKEAREKALDLLRLVGIPDPRKRVDVYPHELSGGMRQRVMIAMALSCDPDLLIADEPTTALDVTIQAQILDLIKRFKQEIGTAVLFISHDLGVIAEVADRVAVFYAGKVVEYADVRSIFRKPLHPYTMGLNRSIPRVSDPKDRDLDVIPGSIPDPLSLPSGCRFHPRCDRCFKTCIEREPTLMSMAEGRLVRCWLYANGNETDGREDHGQPHRGE